jgi:hypothetical protein
MSNNTLNLALLGGAALLIGAVVGLSIYLSPEEKKKPEQTKNMVPVMIKPANDVVETIPDVDVITTQDGQLVYQSSEFIQHLIYHGEELNPEKMVFVSYADENHYIVTIYYNDAVVSAGGLWGHDRALNVTIASLLAIARMNDLFELTEEEKEAISNRFESVPSELDEATDVAENDGTAMTACA